MGFSLQEMCAEYSTEWGIFEMSPQQRQSRFDRSDDVVVMKFGGTSVEDAAAIRRLIEIVRSRLDAQPVLVVSALATVTDQLLEAGNSAAGGRLGAGLDLVRRIYVRHEQLADELVEGLTHRTLEGELRGEFHSLELLLRELDSSRKLDLQSQDRLLGFGECVSSRLVAAALGEAGVHSEHVDARSCIVTDSRHGQASPLWDATNQKIQDTFSPLLDSGYVPVLGGFIAATRDGVPTTLGRGGSDFTAAIVGAALGAARLEIWTDVDGIMTADPKLCPEARVIRKMSFDEAAELAQCGAKVLHPATLAPVLRENIPVHVLNSRRPEGEGTVIAGRAHNHHGANAITAAIAVKRDIAVVEFEARQAVDSELLRDVCALFERHACPVDLMASSAGRVLLVAGSVSSLPQVVVDLQSLTERADRVRHDNVERENGRHDNVRWESVRWENHKALVTLIGEGIRRRPDVANRVLAAVSDLEGRVVGQGESDRTISFLVEESRVEESVQRLHALFFPQRESGRDWDAASSGLWQAG